MQTNPWWKGAVIYQVYPRSMMDSNGDGIGDIPGIITKLDYLASLGIDAIWISPFFKSPMQDFGYDISDYRTVDPIFGDLSDLDQLIAGAHARNIRIIIDQVLSHTSDQHAWFQESRLSRDNPKADWYVWADPKPDGTPPNNWMAIFGGVAWEWEPRRGQYYLHNFLKSQPDLNFHCVAVQKQILEEVEFWLKRGVDGLRLDAFSFCFHDQQLRDNPAKPESERQGRGFSVDNPYAFQRHIYNNERPENIAFIETLRQLMDRYPGSVTLGEISTEDSLKTMAEYTAGGNRLHMTYSFELLVEDHSPQYIRETVENLEKYLTEGWPCWAIGNHDVARVMSRWSDGKPSASKAKLYNSVLFALRGSICTYQGEELGLTEVDIAYDDLQDPYGVTFWPLFKGRDGCRTPMPWVKNEISGGFSSNHKTWLPIPLEHRAQAVDVQDAEPTSILNHFRQLLAFRRTQPALKFGDIQFIDVNDEVLAFERKLPEQKIVALFNFSEKEQTVDVSAYAELSVAANGIISSARLQNKNVILPAYGVFFGQYC